MQFPTAIVLAAFIQLDNLMKHKIWRWIPHTEALLSSLDSGKNHYKIMHHFEFQTGSLEMQC